MYSLEPPQRGGSNEYHNLCFEQKYEKCQSFLSENFKFLEVKFSIYLKKRVFVMCRVQGDMKYTHTHTHARARACVCV